MKPGARRCVVRHLQDAHGVSQRRACRVIEQPLSTERYRSVRADDGPLREHVRQYAAKHHRWGYRRLLWLAQRDGLGVGRTRLQRVYQEEGQQVQRRKRRRKLAARRVPLDQAQRPDQTWGLDFVHDVTTNGRRLRILSIIDLFTRECLALEVDVSLSGHRVARVLSRIAQSRGLPNHIVCDNGPEFTGLAFNAWAKERGVDIAFIQPGKPTQNGYVGSFTGSLRDECLNAHIFTSLDDAVGKIGRWRNEYNWHRPHSSLANLPPALVRGLRQDGLAITTADIVPS